MRTDIAFTAFTLLGCALMSSLSSAPAHAQRARTFVASYGSDTNNFTCSFGQPCKTFQNAYNNTAVGGEVTAIDSAGFGALGISHSITITSPTGVEAGIVPSSGADAIHIFAGPNDVVVLRGLTLEGGGGLNGLEGILLDSAGELEILDCVIKDFHDGVLLQPTTGALEVMIKNTTVLNSSNAGIYFTPKGASVNGTVDQVTANFNGYGMYFDQSQTSGQIDVRITDSHAANNVNAGILFNAGVLATMKNTVLARNQANVTDLVVNGSATQLFLAHGNEMYSLSASGNPTIYSDGSNVILLAPSAPISGFPLH